jgi:hypothetical protein
VRFRPLSRVVLGLYLLVSVPAFALVERVQEKGFTVGAGAKLKVDTYHGMITVSPTDDPQIHVLIRKSMDVAKEEEADRLLADLELKIEQQENTVSVTARDRRAVRWTWQKWPAIPLVFEVKVPRACQLDLVTHDGAINVGDLRGDVRVKTFKGSVFLGQIDGAVDATSVRGDVAITACTQSLTLDARSGNVLVGRAEGMTRTRGIGGSMEIQTARGEIKADADGADLKVGFSHPLTRPADLRASGGDIIINLDPRSSCTLDANASRFGSIRVRELALKIAEGKIGDSHLLAQLNDGGPRLTLRSSGGSIRINGVTSLP